MAVLCTCTYSSNQNFINTPFVFRFTAGVIKTVPCVYTLFTQYTVSWENRFKETHGI